MDALISPLHALSDDRADASCTSIMWLTNILRILNLMGPASEYVCYPPQLSLLMRYTSVHCPVNICALQKEQDFGWSSTCAEHGALCHQCGQSFVLYIAMCLLMGTTTECCIPDLAYQSSCTAELLCDQHGQQEPQHWVGFVPPIQPSIVCIALTHQ